MGVKPLSKLEPGEKGKIIRIRGCPDLHRKPSVLGVVVGRSIEVMTVRAGLDEDPIEINVGGSSVWLDLAEATKVQVETKSKKEKEVNKQCMR